MNYVLLSILVFICSATLAKNGVDLHGLDGNRAQTLLQTYTAQIQAIETPIIDVFLNLNEGHFDAPHYECLVMKKKKLLATIQREGRFAFVDLQTVYYQDKTIYTTLEVIEDPKSERMRFVTKPAHPIWNDLKIWRNRVYRRLLRRQDLIVKMQEYDRLVMRLSITHQLDHDGNDCPAYHCLAAFHHPSLAPYWDVFQQGVAKEKSLILSTLHNDPDPERRAAAAFLVGHFSDPKEIVAVLSTCIDDAASQVRNNALRVIALTLFKSHLNDVDSMPFIKLLDSPFVTDRNKALSVLLGLADNQTNKKKMIRFGGQKIVDLLQLSQPDNHDLAYTLLKKISNQSLGEHQFVQWKTWMTHAQGNNDAFR